MRRTSYRTNLLLAFASTLLMLGLFEAGIRVRAELRNRGLLSEALDRAAAPPADGPAKLGHLIRPARNPRIVYELKPNLSALYKGARVKVNAAGFRGPERPDAAEFARIVGLGDSFMFGQGVGDGETYLAVLEAKLDDPGRDAGSPGRRWRVINTAVPGYNTAMEVETLKEKGIRYAPAVVILGFVGNDLALPNFIRRREPVLSLEKSFLVDFFRHRNPRRSLREKLEAHGLVGAPRGEEPRQPFASDPANVPPEYRDLVGWEAYLEAIAELDRLGREHGFAVVWTALQPSSPTKRRAMQAARQLGFHVVDVGAVFARWLQREGFDDYARSPLALSRRDPHPSPLAHRIAAETIHDSLLRAQLTARKLAGQP